MSKGIFAVMEDLNSNGEEVVDLDEYNQHHEEIRDMHDDIQDDLDTLSDAVDAKETFEAVNNALPQEVTGEGDQNNDETVALGIESICKTLGTDFIPSLESHMELGYRKALKVSLEGKLGDLKVAIISMLKKIRDKIVAFFKRVMEFIKRNTIGRLKKDIEELRKNGVTNPDNKAAFKNYTVSYVFNYGKHPYIDYNIILRETENYIKIFDEFISGFEKNKAPNTRSAMDFSRLMMVGFKGANDEYRDYEILYANKPEDLQKLCDLDKVILDKSAKYLKLVEDNNNKLINEYEKNYPDLAKDPDNFGIQSIKEQLRLVQTVISKLHKALDIYLKLNIAYFKHIESKEGKM